MLKIRNLLVSFLLAALVLGLSISSPAAAADIRIKAGGGQIIANIAPGRLAVSRAELEAWIQQATVAVITYYGQFPVRQLELRIQPTSGASISGTAYGHDLHIDIRLGHNVTATELNQDWVLTHEMLHIAFPDVPDAHQWMKEGLATYVERIARAQTGSRDPKQMWADLQHKLPQGQPRWGDAGLDYTHTWGRTYWGGALFCFVADVEIRRRTGDRYGLQDALKAVLAAGGTLNKRWPLEKALALGDKAVGVPVLSELYEQTRATPVTIDLGALWEQLGVERGLLSIKLNNEAPESDIRRAITGDIAQGRQAKTLR